MCIKMKDVVKSIKNFFNKKKASRIKKHIVRIGDKAYTKKKFNGDIYLEPFEEVDIDYEFKEL